MNINYKGLLNILGLQALLNRVSTVEDNLTALTATVDSIPAPTPSTGITTGTAAAGTLVTIADDDTQNMDFGIGVFPNWPNGDDMIAFGNYGLVIDDNYWGGPAFVNNTAALYVSDGGITMYTNVGPGSSSIALDNTLFKLNYVPSAGLEQRITLESAAAANAGGIQITAAQSGSAVIKLLSGTVAPESAVSAGLGSMYTRINGAAAELYFKKTSPTPTTGWVLVTTA